MTGDCLKVLPTLPRRKFRLVFADPPYNQGIDYGKGCKADQRSDNDYLAECNEWMRESIEVLTPDGALVIVISDNYAADLVNLGKREFCLHLRSWIKWHESFGTNQRDNFAKASRHILYFVLDPKNFVFNEEPFLVPSEKAEKYNDFKRMRSDGLKIRDDVWLGINRLQGNAEERMPDFPTQLPLALVRPIVAGFTEPGDLVLDPFSGSGTTAAACVELGRQYTGIEINESYAAMSRARLAHTQCGAKTNNREAHTQCGAKNAVAPRRHEERGGKS